MNEQLQAAHQIVNEASLRRSMRYQTYVKSLKAIMESGDPKHRAMVQAANAGLAKTKALGPGQVHIDSALSNVSVQYKNGDYIGLELMPVVIVNKRSDRFFVYDKRSRLAYPDDAISARGFANEVTDQRSNDNYSVDDRGFSNFVDAETLSNEDAPLNEMVDLVEAINEGIDFKEESRIATVLTTAGNYPTANKVTIAAGDQWDSVGGGNPISNIQTACAAMWSGRGPSKKVMWSTIGVYNVLARHPQIRDLFKYTSNGLATPAQIAGYFGCSDYLVSEARQDGANEGQTASYSRMFGNFFGVTRVALRPAIRTASFGYTFRSTPKRTDEWFDIRVGVKGGYYARTSLSETHKIVASDTAYLITTPVSTAAAAI